MTTCNTVVADYLANISLMYIHSISLMLLTVRVAESLCVCSYNLHTCTYIQMVLQPLGGSFHRVTSDDRYLSETGVTIVT